MTESAPLQWIDTHCHLDAREFDADRAGVVARANAAGVTMQVLPAVGEIGVDLFLPPLIAIRERQEHFFREQLKIARRAGLPVLVHVRRSSDAVLAGLRRIEVPGGIAHAFNGSDQQSTHFVERGFRLGFGGALTFETARQIRRVAAMVPASAPVLETDSPDIPPHWLYRTAAEREAQVPPLPQARNEPAEVARIAQSLAQLRGLPLAELAALTRANAIAAMPRLAALPTAGVPGH